MFNHCFGHMHPTSWTSSHHWHWDIWGNPVVFDAICNATSQARALPRTGLSDGLPHEEFESSSFVLGFKLCSGTIGISRFTIFLLPSFEHKLSQMVSVFQYVFQLVFLSHPKKQTLYFSIGKETLYYICRFPQKQQTLCFDWQNVIRNVLWDFRPRPRRSSSRRSKSCRSNAAKTLSIVQERQRQQRRMGRCGWTMADTMTDTIHVGDLSEKNSRICWAVGWGGQTRTDDVNRKVSDISMGRCCCIVFDDLVFDVTMCNYNWWFTHVYCQWNHSIVETAEHVAHCWAIAIPSAALVERNNAGSNLSQSWNLPT